MRKTGRGLTRRTGPAATELAPRMETLEPRVLLAVDLSGAAWATNVASPAPQVSQGINMYAVPNAEPAPGLESYTIHLVGDTSTRRPLAWSGTITGQLNQYTVTVDGETLTTPWLDYTFMLGADVAKDTHYLFGSSQLLYVLPPTEDGASLFGDMAFLGSSALDVPLALVVVPAGTPITVTGLAATPSGAGYTFTNYVIPQPAPAFDPNYSVTNSGTTDSGGFDVKVYLSSDVVIGDAGDQLLGTVHYDSLAAGQTVTGSLPTSSFVVGQTRWVGIVIDPDNVVVETNEGNNTAGAAFHGPDLTITAPTFDMTNRQAGDTLGITAKVRNLGGVEVPASSTFSASYYLSTDTVWGDGNDRLMLTVPYSSGIAPGAELDASGSALIPQDLAAGSYYLAARVWGSNIPETDATNNIWWSAAPVLTVAPEIDVANEGTVLTSNQGTLDFGSVLLNATAPVLTFVVTNSGSARLTLGTPQLPTGFALVDPLSATLAPGAGDTFSVRMETTAIADRAGQIFFATSDSDENPFIINVVGSIVPALPDIVVRRGSTPIADGELSPVVFGPIQLGMTAPTVTFTVANTGTADLTLGVPELPAGFTLAEGLNDTLAPGASDTFTVQLDNTAAGLFAGEIVIATNVAEVTSFNFAISGEVIDQTPLLVVTAGGVAVTDGQAAAINFGVLGQGDAGRQMVFTVSNPGMLELTTSDLTLPAGFTLVEGLSATIAAGDSDTFTVRMDAVLLGHRAGEITFTSTVAGLETFNIPVAGDVKYVIDFDARNPGKYFDGSGGAVTVKLTGLGAGRIFLALNGNDDADRIALTGTTLSSSLTITTARGDLTTVGEMAVDGAIKAIKAKTTSLGSSLVVSGAAGGITLDDVTGRIDIGPRAALDTRTVLALIFDQAVELAVTSATPLKSLTLTEWQDNAGPADTLVAPWLGTLKVKGRRATRANPTALRGDFEAGLTLSGAGVAFNKNTLNSATVAGDLAQAVWSIGGNLGTLKVTGTADHSQIRASGNMNSVTLGASVSSDFLADVQAAVGRHATAHNDFVTKLGTIKSFAIKGFKAAVPPPSFFVDSNLTASLVGKVSLLNVQYDNSGEGAFGVYVFNAGPGYEVKLITAKDTVPKTTWKWPDKLGTAFNHPDMVTLFL